jgi:hypothetical protein
MDDFNRNFTNTTYDFKKLRLTVKALIILLILIIIYFIEIIIFKTFYIFLYFETLAYIVLSKFNF